MLFLIAIAAICFCGGCGTEDMKAENNNLTNVLILSGQNNHAWQQTTPVLVELFEQNENFRVDIDEQPENLTADKLEKYDVIVSNYNTFGDATKPKKWSEKAQKAFLDFIRQGKGHVTVHAGGSSFYDWPEYHKIVPSWGSKTNHGPLHVFQVRPTDTEHPITKGLEDFSTKDEFWNDTVFPEGSVVLLDAFSSPDYSGSGKNEPLLTVSKYGRGRCAGFMLGHDVQAMSNPGFGQVFVRSVEWAATGSVKP